MLAAPMIRSGQTSCQSEPSDAPSRIAARIPSSAYVAGEIFAIHCILGQHLDGVVDARDDEQHPLGDEAELGALLRRDEREDHGRHSDPEERDRRDDQDHEHRDEVRVLELETEERRDDDEQQDRPDEPIEDSEDARPPEVHRPGERRHERVLDRPLPALPGHGLREELEDDSEVGPDHFADQQGRRHAIDVDLAAARLDPLAMKTIVSVFATVQTKNARSRSV